MTDPLDALHTILTDVDEILRERLKEFGAGVAHILVAIGPDGTAIVRGNVDAPGLKAMGAELVDLAEDASRRPDDDEPIH